VNAPDPKQFARVKALFDQLVDLNPAQQQAALASSDEDPAVLSQLRALLAQNARDTEQLASPVLQALHQVSTESARSGDVLGAWTLLEEIGQGGMGRVFLARRSDGHFEQMAAIKLLSGQPSTQALRFLARERQILASLAHPHIARLLDGGSTPQGQPYLVMEYVRGQSIDEYCRQQQPSLTTRLRLLIDICAAVSFAHRQLVVHCDLKPSNILVTAEGRPILLDFGVSRLLADVDPAAPSTASAGTQGKATTQAYTPRYASPEQRAGERVGTATDIYSLGVTLAELLGVSPDPSGALTLGGLPPELAAIIARATDAEIDRRYVTVQALAEDLRRYLEHLPVQACKPTLSYVSRKWLRRRWPLAAAALLLVVVVSAFSWRMRIERDNALTAERSARALADYMISVFQGADPEVSGQRDLPVSKLLDAGHAGLASKLEDQPALRAEVTGILGSVYQNIGQRDRALTLFDEAIAIQAVMGDPPKLAQLMHKKAYSLYDKEDFPAAEPVAREALALHEQVNPNTAELVHSLRLLGGILTYKFGGNDQAESMALLSRALQLAEQVDGADSVLAAQVHLDLGRHHGFLSIDASPVVTHSRTARRIIAERLGEQHYLYAEALEILVLGLRRTAAFEEALPLARRLGEMRSAFYGDISYQAGYALYAYAGTLKEAGRRLEAIPVLKRCLTIQEQLDGRDSLASTPIRKYLAEVYMDVGAYQDAIETFEAIINLRTALLPEGKRDLLVPQGDMAAIRRQQGDLATADALASEVLRARRADPGTHPYRLALSQIELAAIRTAQGRLDEAGAVLDEVDVAAFSGWILGQSALDSARAKLAWAQGQLEQAQTLYLKAEAQQIAGLGEVHPRVWIQRLERAELLAAQGQRAAAADLARQIRVQAASTILPGGALDLRVATLIADRDS
jgi:eukaryotic-like serine/threonine-protein kinase